MRIDVHNARREHLFDVEVDPKRPPPVVKPVDGAGTDIYLRWDQALDDQGYLRRCPVCGCQELFCRRDFPQAVGMGLVVGAVVISFILFALDFVQTSLFVLCLLFVLDAAVLHLLTGYCLVCYRCRSEFRALPIRKDHPTWDLATGEKYRAEVAAPSDNSAAPPPPPPEVPPGASPGAPPGAEGTARR